MHEQTRTNHDIGRTGHSFFTVGNMSDLANSMHTMLENDASTGLDASRHVDSTPSILYKKKELDIGPIQLVRFSVENPKDAMKFCTTRS